VVVVVAFSKLLFLQIILDPLSVRNWRIHYATNITADNGRGLRTFRQLVLLPPSGNTKHTGHSEPRPVDRRWFREAAHNISAVDRSFDNQLRLQMHEFNKFACPALERPGFDSYRNEYYN
jgi:hypothetical protein